MKEIGYREIRHIVANHAIKNRATGYCRRSKSVSFKIVRKLIRNKWLECCSENGPFLFVKPTEKLMMIYGGKNQKVTSVQDMMISMEDENVVLPDDLVHVEMPVTLN